MTAASRSGLLPSSLRAGVCAPKVVGRRRELAVLENALCAARSGQGSLVVLSGEAGIGKSRLAREISREAGSAGMCALWGRAAPECGPFRPLGEALLRASRNDGFPKELEIEALRPILGRFLPGGTPNDAVPVDGVGDAVVVIAEAVVRLLGAISRPCGALIVLDDLHWADSETLAVLDYVADDLASMRVVCVMALRPDEPSPALDLVNALQARRSAVSISLYRLRDEEVRQIAASCLGQEAIPEGIGDFLVSRADGIPLLVEELLTALIDSRTLCHGSMGWEVSGRIRPNVPLTFAGTVYRRSESLDDVERNVLAVAAVLGKQFDCELLGSLTRHGHPAIVRSLRALVDRNLLEFEPRHDATDRHDTIRFRHTLTRDAVLERLLPIERADIAARAAATVKRLHPDLEGNWCELSADLHEQAGDWRRAAELLLELGQRALAIGAIRSAENYLRRGADHAQGHPTLAVRLERELLGALAIAGNVSEASDIGQRLLGTLTVLGATDAQLLDTRLQLASAFVTAERWNDARVQLKAARTLLLRGDSTRRSRLDVLVAAVAMGQRRVDKASIAARSALNAATTSGAAEVACAALEIIGRIARLHDLDEAESAFSAAHALASRHRLSLSVIRAQHELGTIDMLRSGSVSRLLEARDLASHAGALTTAAVIDLQLAGSFAIQFRADEALDAAQRCADAGRRLRLDPLVAGAAIRAAAAHATQVRHAEMERAIEQAMSHDGFGPEVHLLAYQARGVLATLAEDRAEAIDRFGEAVAWTEDSDIPALAIGMYGLLRALHRNAPARATRRHMPVPSSWGPLNLALARYAEAVMAARRQGPEQAERVFASAETLISGWNGGDGFRHMCRRLVAEAAIADGWGEPVVWLRAALRHFDGAPYGAFNRACRTLLREAGAQVPRRGRGDAQVPAVLAALGVTSREMDVLELVAQGLSNVAIAEHLSMSRRTVETHVGHLRTKTGCKARVELGDLANSVTGTS